MSIYRVYVKRTYIAVEWYDVVEGSPARAEGKAKKAAQKLRPDPRAEATDNGWLTGGGAILVREPGAWAHGKHAMREVAKDVYQAAPEPPDLLATLRAAVVLGAQADQAIADDEWASARSYLLEADKLARAAIEEHERHRNVTTV